MTKYEPVVTKDGDIETAVSCPDQTPVAKKVEDVTHMECRRRKRPFLKGVFVGVIGTLLILKLHVVLRHCHKHHHPGHYPGDHLPPPPLPDFDIYSIPEPEMMQKEKKMWDKMDMDMDIEKKMWHDKKMHGHHGMKKHGDKMHGHHGMKMYHDKKHMVDKAEPEIMILEEELKTPEELPPLPSLAVMETEEAVEEVDRRVETP